MDTRNSDVAQVIVLPSRMTSFNNK